MQHDGLIYWPNGLGETPCSKEYEAKSDEMWSILDPTDSSQTLDALSPADYNRYCQLEHDLGVMQLNGHVGKYRRY